MDVYGFLLNISIVLLIGFLFGKILEHFKIPAITGYILAGVLIGPHGLNLIDQTTVSQFNVITNVVLAIIAYQIGTELFIPILKRNAGRIIMITLVHAFITLVIVFGGVWLVSGELWLAFALSGLAIASAPAPVMAIIKKLRAKGPVKSTVVPVVGVLDVVAVIVFGLTSSIALSLVGGETIGIQNALLNPLYEVVLSIFVGAIFGVLLGLFSHFFVEKFRKQDRYLAYLAVSLSFILIGLWIAQTFHLSTILIPLTIGVVFTNFVNEETFDIQDAALNNFGGPFIIIFFTIAGLGLNPAIMLQAGFIALVFIVLRSIGKISGSYFASTLSKCPMTVRKYTGLCLLPQAGVTIGMLVALSASLPPEETQIVQTITLTSILIFQVAGPILMKWGLEKAGESREL